MELKKLFFRLSLMAAILASTTLQAESPNIIWIGHTNLDRINAVIFNHSGDTLISGSSDRLINFWRVSDGTLLRTLNTEAPFVHESAIEWLSITKDGSRLASASYQVVKLWTLPQGTVKNLSGHTDWVVSVSFSPNGQLLASASFDGTVRIWRASDGAFLRSISNPRQMRVVAFSPDGTLLAGAGGDADVHLWRTSDWTEARILDGHTTDIYTLTFSPDGTKLASGGYDQTVKVWNVATGTNLYTLGENNGNVYGIAFTPDGTQLAYSDGEGSTIRVHRVSDGARLRTFTENVDQVQTMAFSPSGLLGYGIVDERVYLTRIDGSGSSPTLRSLTKTVFGSGTVQVTPPPNGPSGTYSNGTVVTLRATASGTNRFIGWSGAISSTATNISITMNANKSVIATFTTNIAEEIVWQNHDRKLATWLMDGTTYKGSLLCNNGLPVATGWDLACIGDFNSDAQKDFLFQHADGRTALWLMKGHNRTSAALLRNGLRAAAGWKAVGTGDFTLDGKTDILFQRGDGCIALWTMNGTNYTSAMWLNNAKSAGREWRVVGTGDFNGDQKPDLLWFNTNNRTTAIWEMNGTTRTKSYLVHGGVAPVGGWRAVGAGDFNNDHQIDILWHHRGGKLAAWFLNKGNYTGAAYLRNGEAAGTAWDVVGIK